jgi:ADP-ribose pyrophosphatase YjhB (NUDIX family)
VREETGLDVEPEEIVAVFDHISHASDDPARVRFHYVLIDYRCRVLGGALMSATDVTEARWATWSELTGHGAVGIRPFTLSVIRKALDQVSKRTAGEHEIVTRETGMSDSAAADSMHPAGRKEPFP